LKLDIRRNTIYTSVWPRTWPIPATVSSRGLLIGSSGLAESESTAAACASIFDGCKHEGHESNEKRW
jgi:hypothetical protein